jgi:tRNA G10  N-methylase Trm11
MAYLYLLSCDEYEQELARAELWAFTGLEGRGRVATGPQAAEVRHAAYVAACAELLASGDAPRALAEALAGGEHRYERFRVTLVTLPPRPHIDGHEAIVRVAESIDGSVDLVSPLTELLLVGSANEWYLGRVISRSGKSFRRHEHKPRGFSSSLPARIARCMVNLVPGAGTIIDPCCGAGTILLEAWATGRQAVGADLNPKLAAMTRANLEHFGYPRWVCVADAATFAARGDAVVTDLPYGRQSARTAGLYERLLSNFPSLAPRLCLVTAAPVENQLESAGYDILRVACTRRGGFERRVYVARVRDHGSP